MGAATPLRALVEAFDDPRVGYACGQVRFVQAAAGADATNQEGRVLALRDGRPRARVAPGSITAGNGAIYATRAEAYLVVDPVMGHDLSFPFNMVKRGWRAVYVPGGAREREDGPLDRGRVRAQAAHDEPRLADRPARRDALAARLRAGYAVMIVSHRAAALRHARRCTPSRCSRTSRWWSLGAGPLYVATLVAPGRAPHRRCARRAAVRSRPLLVARYYVLTTASLAAGLWDWLRHGTRAGWDAAEGTR